MKLITAILKPHKLEDVKNALALNAEVTIIEFFKMQSIKFFSEQVRGSIWSR